MSEDKRLLTDDSSTFIEDYSSDSDLSSDGLEIDISESPNKKEIDIEDKRVLENIEEEIERQYDDKAAKSNLTAINVKNILKHVITNEHVWAMVRNSTDENNDAEQAVYEPKLTRAKAKELLKTQNVPAAAIPWTANPVPKSEVHILINEELPEDSDDDEYVPHEEESEDEKESFKSDFESQPATPATPTSTHDNSTQTTWTEDGIFKVPQSPAVPKTPSQETEQETIENIALRTRSKLSLSDTPLEIIEEAFIPPDITTDMYDLECDDEDWKDFLKKFTRPLDEAVTGQDDDDADPEYNILSDEELDKLDKKEELRVDKGVKIPKKELNTLISELLEFSEMFENAKGLETQLNTGQNQNNQENTQETFNQGQSFSETQNFATGTPQNFSGSQNFTANPSENFQENNTTENFQGNNTSENFQANTTENFQGNTTGNFNQSFNSQKTDRYLACQAPQPERKICVVKDRKIIMTQNQLRLFEQQMRQHVQMLTQNYILCYKHTYVGNFALSFKNMLLSLDELSKYKTKTTFRAYNLNHCVDFLKEWEEMIASDTKEVRDMLTHLINTSVKYNNPRETNWEYFLTFPQLLLKKVSQSSAFMYPTLLPKIPFRHFRETKKSYLKSENELIALGLEQFTPYLKSHPLYKTRNGQPSKEIVFSFISKFMMPHRDPKSLYFYIQRMRYAKDPNPINHYYHHKKAPIATHYVLPLEQFGCLPPCERPADMLPIQWKHYNYVETRPPPRATVRKVNKPPAYNRRPRKKKVKITPESQVQDSSTNTTQTSSQPLLVINNFIPLNRKPVPIAPKPAEGIHLVIPNPYQIAETSKEPEPEKLVSESNSPKDNQQQLETPKTTKQPESPKTTKQPESPKLTKKRISHKPKVEQIFIKTEEYYICNTTEIRPNFSEINSVDSEPPPISTTEQIKKFSPDLLNLKFNSSIFSKVKELDMLPSMPFLQTPVKDKNNDPEIEIEEEDPLKISAFETKTEDIESKVEEIKSSEENETNEPGNLKKDDEDELNALMIASSTIQKSKRLQPNLTKKAKQMKEYNATLAMVCPENEYVKEEKAKNFAQAYYDKVQERLESESPLEYQKFVEVLSEHDETSSTVSDLYEKVSSVLNPKHPDLCEEFLSFLTPEQAQQIGKLVPHFMLSNMSLFLRKLEIYYNNQPAQLRRIYNSLTELSETENVTIEKVKNTILPLLKGNALLIDWFLQMFPQEPPTESMLTNWEQICYDEDQDEDNKFETLTLPEIEDPYGGPNCICKCHKLDDEMYKTRARHCVPCGTKFMQGRVYVQTGKGLRLANVTFNSPNRIQQLSVKPTTRPKRKSETSPSKIIMSPTKDPEQHNSNESEDDGDNTHKKMKKSFRTSSPSKSRKKPAQKTPKTKKETKIKKSDTKKTKKPKKESEEMDTCEESSQDTLEESDDSLETETENSEDSSSPLEAEISECHNWTRDEDRIILESFQKCDQGQNVYKYIQKLLPGRKEQEIKQRFHILINLVREMSCEN